MPDSLIHFRICLFPSSFVDFSYFFCLQILMEIWEQEDKRPTLVAAASIRRPPAGRIKTIATRTLRFKKK